MNNKTKSQKAIEYYLDVLDEARGENWREKPDHVGKKFLDAANNFGSENSIIQVQAMMNFWLFCNNAGYNKIYEVVYSLDVADRIKDIVWNVYNSEVRKNNSPYFFNTITSLDASLRGKIMVAIMEQYSGISIKEVQETYLGQ